MEVQLRTVDKERPKNLRATVANSSTVKYDLETPNLNLEFMSSIERAAHTVPAT
jgi:hypothetical protein